MNFFHIPLKVKSFYFKVENLFLRIQMMTLREEMNTIKSDHTQQKAETVIDSLSKEQHILSLDKRNKTQPIDVEAVFAFDAIDLLNKKHIIMI